jgi:PHD/YefM family antitoxin component YafN of YafNO toxin-antitoxin module
MTTVHPRYIVDARKRPQAVVLPVKEWRRIVEDLEELDDIRAYDEAKSGPQDAIPLEQALCETEEGKGA